MRREIKFKTHEEFQKFEKVLQIIKYDELLKYNEILNQLRWIDAELKVKDNLNIDLYRFSSLEFTIV